MDADDEDEMLDDDELLDDDLVRRLRDEPLPPLPADYQRTPGRACEIARAFRYADQGRFDGGLVGFCRHRPRP